MNPLGNIAGRKKESRYKMARLHRSPVYLPHLEVDILNNLMSDNPLLLDYLEVPANDEPDSYTGFVHCPLCGNDAEECNCRITV